MFITRPLGPRFYTCSPALSPEAVHNPHELSTELSTACDHYPLLPEACMNGLDLCTGLWTRCITVRCRALLCVNRVTTVREERRTPALSPA